MFKLMVVGGPAKGTAYEVKDGETTIGRVNGNDIVLQSQKVSKKHCVLVVNNSDVTVKDAGSSNGTFVNGVLTKIKRLVAGDRVSVGEYVFELREVEQSKQIQDYGNVIPFTGNGIPVSGMPVVSGGINYAAAGGASTGIPHAAAPPQDFSEKIKFYFDKYILNFVYNLNEKHEWHVMMAGMFAAVAVLGAVLSVYPLFDRIQIKLSNETAQRALLLARQIVDRNAPFIYGQTESKADIGFVENEIGVRTAYLIDMEGRVMAPGRKLNQYLSESTEAAFSAASRASFNEKEIEKFIRIYGDLIAVAVPLKIFNQSSGKNEARALGLVFFDRNMILFDSGTEALSYIQGIILSGIVAVLMFFSLYRLTLRPLLALNDEIDQVLKGNATTVTKKYKMEEISPLIDVVNAALQRASSGNSASAGAADQMSTEDLIGLLRFAGNRMTGVGMMVFSADRRIMFISAFMEEITGIRNDSAIGADIGSTARDSAFISFVEDILARAPSASSGPIVEDFEFSGTNYKMECLAIGQTGAYRAYVLTALRPS